MNIMTQNIESSSTESHVARAMRGPSPDNPSLSLKKRLKRAAFFDQRDRAVAQGRADPVSSEAGLPGAGEGFMLQPNETRSDDRLTS